MMMTRFDLQPAYLLHARPYRESSLLLDVFTREQGRMTILARGFKRTKIRALLQPFVPLWLSAAGKTELLLLKGAELRAPIYFLSGRPLVCAFYMNELCARLMHRFDPSPVLFEDYEKALSRLLEGEPEQKVLRLFEKALLKSLGYALPLEQEMHSGAPVHPEQWYSFNPAEGPVQKHRWDLSTSGGTMPLFKGSTLLAFAQECFEDHQVLLELKLLMRQILAHYLGPKPLQTSQLF
jgi:DNA repair protein RecO (recombination protein O)